MPVGRETINKFPADYDTVVDLGQEQQKEKARPELSAHVENMDDYNTIFIGFPNWWYDLPMAVYTFLEAYDFSDKTVIPFTTHEGSRFSNNDQTIKKHVDRRNRSGRACRQRRRCHRCRARGERVAGPAWND